MASREGHSFGIEPYGYVAVPNGNGKAEVAKGREGSGRREAGQEREEREEEARPMVEPVADKGLSPIMARAGRSRAAKSSPAR
jgi:hypothetical protein